jgi:hypothetical protein
MIKSGEAAMSKENKIYKKLIELVYPMADGLNNEVSWLAQQIIALFETNIYQTWQIMRDSNKQCNACCSLLVHSDMRAEPIVRKCLKHIMKMKEGCCAKTQL